MTTMQKALMAGMLAAAVGTGIYEARQVSTLRDEIQRLRQQHAPLAERVQQLTRERDDAARQLSALRDENERMNRNTAELMKLRGEVAQLRNAARQMAIAPGVTNAPDGGGTIGQVRWRPEWKDVGAKTPEAAIETYCWAVMNGNVDRVRQSMVFRGGSGPETVSELYARRETRDSSIWKGAALGGVRLARTFPPVGIRTGNLADALADVEVEVMRPGIETGQVVPVDAANPPPWTPQSNSTFHLEKLDDEWKIVADEHRLKLSLDAEEDSEEVARMLIGMPPEESEAIKSNIPAKTLEMYEALKAKGVK